jgi:site-specific DNA-methyltransferase (adenine-specific)
MNPPYGREVRLWIARAHSQAKKGNLTVALLPARTDTKWFHDYIYGQHEVRFVKGRLKFGGSKNPAPFPSMIVIFRSEALTTLPF